MSAVLSVMLATPQMYGIPAGEYPISTTIVTMHVISGSHVSPGYVASNTYLGRRHGTSGWLSMSVRVSH